MLLLRTTVGLLVAAHGCQKRFGWFGAEHREPVRAEFEGYGYRPACVFAAAAGVTELLGGTMLAAGLGTALAAALIAGTSAVAAAALAVALPRRIPFVGDRARPAPPASSRPPHPDGAP